MRRIVHDPRLHLATIGLVLLSLVACGQGAERLGHSDRDGHGKPETGLAPSSSPSPIGVIMTSPTPSPSIRLNRTPTKHLERSQTMPESRTIPRQGLPRGLTLRAIRVREKYHDLLWRQPNVWGMGVGLIESAPGQYTGEVGIRVEVATEVPQEDLPLDDRLPAFLGGVPVQIIERPQFISPWGGAAGFKSVHSQK